MNKYVQYMLHVDASLERIGRQITRARTAANDDTDILVNWEPHNHMRHDIYTHSHSHPSVCRSSLLVTC